uniref:Ig-like domain-containing protein n=1 Tax=Fundulus heteroclitus TaxID=8078 RepID=A0A3Q2R0G0_FUNHE
MRNLNLLQKQKYIDIQGCFICGITTFADCFVLILYVFWSQIRLEQSPFSVVKKPGETVMISCAVNGFDIDGEYVHWTRQKSGKALEWIGRHSRSSEEYSSSFASRSDLSYDESGITARLSIRSLTEGDAATYFCAHTHCDALDYWGSGTRLTVTSAPVPPALVPMVWFNSASRDKVTLSCLALDFYPESLSFEWSDASGAQLDSVRYPAVGTNNRFTEVNLSYTARCSALFLSCLEAMCPPQLTLLSETTGAGQTLVCTVEDLSSESLSIKWKKNGNEVYGHNDWVPKQLGDSYSAVSVLKVKSSDWDTEAVYSCEATHLGETYTKKASKALITVTLNPPSPKIMFSNGQVELECIISGQDNVIVSGTKMTWYINEQKHASGNLEEVTAFEGSQYSKRVKGIPEPKVTIHMLPEKETSQEASAEVTLVCLVSSDVVQDYYIAWTEDVGQSNSAYFDGITFPPRKTQNSYSVISVYTTTKEKWTGGYIFYCNVWPAGRENRMKSIGVSEAMGNSAECETV